MRRSQAIATFATICLTASQVLALDVSSRAEAPVAPDKLWAAVGDFCGIAKWHPVIVKCELSQRGGDTIRTLTAKNGGVLTEKLVKLDEPGRSYSYQIVNGPLPVANYVSTIAVAASGAGSSVVWSGHFDAKGASDAEAVKLIQGIYDSGLANLVKSAAQ